MEKKILIVIIVFVVLAALVYLQLSNNKENPNTQLLGQVNFPTASSQTSTSTTTTPSPTVTVNQLQMADIKIGTGSAVKSGDTVKINYAGTLTNGQKFDSSYDRGQPFETQIGVGKVIKGWDLGVIGMKVGGKRRLIIPPDLGYGEKGVGGVIPPNATLVFDLELLEIK